MIRAFFLAVAIAPAAVFAEENDVAAKPYTETKFGQITPDFSNLDPAWAIGQSAGYPIPGLTWAAVELDLQVTLLGGENSGAASPFSGGGSGEQGDGNCPDPGSTTDPDCPLFSGDDGGSSGDGGQNQTRTNDPFRMFGYGIYASVTTPGKLFARVKYGVTGINTSIPEIQELGGGPAWKAGIGYRASRQSLVSLEYTRYNELLDGVHLGLVYGFGED